MITRVTCQASGISILATLAYGGFVFVLFAIFPKNPEIGMLMIGMPVVLFGTLFGQAYTPVASHRRKKQQYKDLEV